MRKTYRQWLGSPRVEIPQTVVNKGLDRLAQCRQQANIRSGTNIRLLPYGDTRPFLTNALWVNGQCSAKAASICSATSSISRCG